MMRTSELPLLTACVLHPDDSPVSLSYPDLYILCYCLIRESWLTGNSSQIVSPAGNAEEESIQFVSAISIASEEDTF